ncbi:hypothetical protein [Kordiimonas marina]|uniref:hypothetical protein n=1 Tax=Kordiimonas marina TaxID=2872312 RepID=UPI001FF6329C|nr:hypothetical protein [Kordiimonas marina]MCJ9429008.1 hypothetical protein [Kordiimonas marina]
MLSFAHMGIIIGFIVMGALGMAALQDGLSIVWRNLPFRPSLRRTPLRGAKPAAVRPQRA